VTSDAGALRRNKLMDILREVAFCRGVRGLLLRVRIKNGALGPA
jgi:hypothetical protein